MSNNKIIILSNKIKSNKPLIRVGVIWSASNQPLLAPFESSTTLTKLLHQENREYLGLHSYHTKFPRQKINFILFYFIFLFVHHVQNIVVCKKNFFKYKFYYNDNLKIFSKLMLESEKRIKKIKINDRR